MIMCKFLLSMLYKNFYINMYNQAFVFLYYFCITY